MNVFKINKKVIRTMTFNLKMKAAFDLVVGYILLTSDLFSLVIFCFSF